MGTHTINTSTILSYSKSVEQEHNHNQIKSHQNQHPPVYICSCGSAQCPKHRTQDLLGCKGAWATLPQGCFGWSTAHTSCHVRWNLSTPIIDMGGCHIVLVSPMFSGLYCKEAIPSTMESPGLSQLQAVAVLYMPFDPSAFSQPKPVPPGKFLHIIKFGFQHEKQPLPPLNQSFS